MTGTVKGYKVFNPNWTCRDFEYEVGKTYKYNGDIELCRKGFHFCVEAVDCFNYYEFDSYNKVAEVEAVGIVQTNGSKSVTDEIKIVRELDWLELLRVVNTGKDCTGYKNSGDYNSGDYNSGDWNSGSFNSGYGNFGYNNSGDWNSGHGNSGVFCTEEPKIKIFDIQSDMTLEEWRSTEASQILNSNFGMNVWVPSAVMTDEEKIEHPSYETTSGYLRTLSFKEAFGNMWNSLTDREKEVIKNIPNFNEKKFKEITGIDV